MADTHTFIYFFSQFIQILILAVGGYFFCISIVGWIRQKEDKGTAFKPEKTFALIVPAHNEEKVIAQMVKSLKALNYPSELYDIFVIADNCTDSTAEVAQRNGAIVLQRSNRIEKGKGFAVEWAFNKIFKMERQYDAISIFDADNIVSKNFLLEMNKQLCKGHKVVQGYIDSKNPFDSWITCSYSIAFWTANRLFQLPRYYLGLSCGLCGTGFCISTDVIKEIGWGATCLTEDLEFTMKLALNNMKVAWCHDAVVYDEKPLTLIQSWRQRKRWMQGHADCTIRFFGLLIKKAIKEKNIIAFDCALYLLQPLRIIVYGLVTVMAYLQWFYPQGTFFTMDYVFPGYIWSTFVVTQFLYGPLIIAAERKFNLKVFLGYFIYPFYSLTWVPITILGILNVDSKEWSHTVHTRDIGINELEQQA